MYLFGEQAAEMGKGFLGGGVISRYLPGGGWAAWGAAWRCLETHRGRRGLVSEGEGDAGRQMQVVTAPSSLLF